MTAQITEEFFKSIPAGVEKNGSKLTRAQCISLALQMDLFSHLENMRYRNIPLPGYLEGVIDLLSF